MAVKCLPTGKVLITYFKYKHCVLHYRQCSHKYMIATTSLARYSKHCIWQVWGSTTKWKRQSFSIQTHKRSLLLMFWCCGVRFSKVTYQKNGTECRVFTWQIYRCDITVWRRTSAHLYTRRYLQWQHPNHRTYISLERHLQEIGHMHPNMPNTGRP